MPTRLRLLHMWQQQVRTLLPTVRLTRAANLALCALGLLWAGTTSLPEVAAALPLPAADASLERRLRRWLANTAVVVGEWWASLVPALLAGKAGHDLLLVFDPPPQNDAASILVLGLVDHHRVLPLAWRVLPQQAAGPARQISYLRAMLEEVRAALPAGCSVTLIADRGITGPEVIDLCRELGWHYVLRVSVGPAQATRVQLPDAPEDRLWDVGTGPGQRQAGPALLVKDAGWRAVELTIRWDRTAAEPWVLVSDRPAGTDRVREYRRRVCAEATYQDCKRRGFDVERSKLTDRDRFDRLLLALHRAVWWGQQLGWRVVRTGRRRRFDRAARRDLSVLRLGRRFLAEDRLHDRCPPLPFHSRRDQWRYAWLS